MIHNKNVDIAIVGGGPAGMSAAVKAYECGMKNILIIEREEKTGGILKQCIHNGFGLHKFKKELTGPEYAAMYQQKIKEYQIPTVCSTFVTDIDYCKDTKIKTLHCMNSSDGCFEIKAKAVILAMGCRERPRGALNIPGARPSGIFSAGTAQKYVNIYGTMPGKNVVILGSGDIGLIMARRMVLEGANVKCVCELLPYSGGLNRNIVQCLNDFDIPLKLSHTVSAIHGKERLCGVTVSKVDQNKKPIAGTEEYIECDTLLLSCGLIPENELSKSAGVELDGITGGPCVSYDRMTNIDGVFACGNVLHVHDLADYASDEAEIAGKSACDYVNGNLAEGEKIKVETANGVRYTVPQYVKKGVPTELYFRVSDCMTNVTVSLYDGETLICSRKRKKVAPGEMEKLPITAEKASLFSGNSLLLKITEENA